jgi:hypothetical protein
MKFIELTRSSSQNLTRDHDRVLINTTMITALVELGPPDQSFNTQLFTIGGGSHVVRETIEEIQKLIEESERVTLKTWETGPR